MGTKRRRKDVCFWPVHFHTTEKQRGDLEKYADVNGVSLGAAARDLLDAGLKARGFEA